APGAAERALASDLNRQHGDPAAQDPPPGGQQVPWDETRIERSRTHLNIRCKSQGERCIDFNASQEPDLILRPVLKAFTRTFFDCRERCRPISGNTRQPGARPSGRVSAQKSERWIIHALSRLLIPFQELVTNSSTKLRLSRAFWGHPDTEKHDGK